MKKYQDLIILLDVAAGLNDDACIFGDDYDLILNELDDIYYKDLATLSKDEYMLALKPYLDKK